MRYRSKPTSFWLAVGLIAAAFILASAFIKFKEGPKTVSVRGLSERQVQADMALWPVKATITAATLEELYSSLDTSQKNIKAFFLSKGFKESELSTKQPRITDREAQLYGDLPVNKERYIADFGFLIKSDRLELIKKAINDISELIAKGVSLSSSEVEYIYTKLNDIKPEMIREATLEAKKSAEQFALNSDSKIAGLKNAYQGLFSIEPIHYYTQDVKKIRVVTNLTYFLK